MCLYSNNAFYNNNDNISQYDNVRHFITSSELTPYFSYTISNYIINNINNNICDIVEFGPGRGQTTITMALALKENGYGKIYSYDIWDDEYWGDIEKCIAQKNIVNTITKMQGCNHKKW